MFLDVGDVDAYTQNDLDALLQKATSELSARATPKVLPVQDGHQEDSVVSDEKGSKTTLSHQKVKLDVPLKTDGYFVETSKKGAVRLNPAKIQIIEPDSKQSADEKRSIGNDLAKGSTKSLIKRIVVSKPKNEVPPEVDFDEKTKKKMAVETAGPKWFDMPAPELTDSLKREIQIIKARNVLDPKRHYKREDKNAPEYPKFFQMGTVVAGAADFFSGRRTRREQKDGLVQEVLHDAPTKNYLKRKFVEINGQKALRARHPTTKKRRGKDSNGSQTRRR
ncbi:hypothetical protein HDU84_007093 [Entophlyctis sp. JEL0112]|nr:hypothetical protein HDU84_007093 [Entophlyctis sp. JEL0112]